MDDILDEIDELAEYCDDKDQIIQDFVKEDLPTCQGYVLAYIDDKGRVCHLRWAMRPWQVRGALADVIAYLDADKVVQVSGED